MGCDIHFFVEVKDEKTGAWVCQDKFYKDDDGYTHMTGESFYNQRSYDTFAMLADVRNGYGFEGIKTGEGFTPIEAPKGMPNDVSKEIKAESDDWGVDGHSHSHLTLAELLAYDFNGQTTGKQGLVSPATFIKWKASGEAQPESWCGNAFGGETVIVNEHSLIADEAGVVEIDGITHIDCTWQVAYADSAHELINTTIPKLKALHEDPEKVRCVFFFDN